MPRQRGPPVEPGIFQIVVQGGCFALIAYIIVWAVNKGIPKIIDKQGEMQKEFLVDMRQVRAEHREDRKELNTQIAQLSRSIDSNTDATRQLANSCRKG